MTPNMLLKLAEQLKTSTSLAELSLGLIPTGNQAARALTPSPSTVLGYATVPLKWTADAIGGTAHDFFTGGLEKQHLANDVALRERTLKGILGAGTLALGAGAGLRGLQGLSEASKTRPTYRPHSPEATIPYPVKRPPEEEKKAEQSILTDPLFLGGTAAFGIGGAYAGYKGMDMALNAQKERARKAELEKARQDFEQTLLASYSTPRTAIPGIPVKEAETKTAAQEIGEILGKVYDRLTEKQALPTLGDVIGGVGNLYGAYAVGSGLLGGAAAYDYATKKNRDKILQQAIKERAQRALEYHPLELTPEPRYVGGAV